MPGATGSGICSGRAMSLLGSLLSLSPGCHAVLIPFNILRFQYLQIGAENRTLGLCGLHAVIRAA
jgi:hypothetical protein